ncbi:MAG: hypothetical protein CL920_24275 [Deltaproteobacteria bacterium]|nr:hypothetical protein [Deltaproteobacteria bacterium]
MLFVVAVAMPWLLLMPCLRLHLQPSFVCFFPCSSLDGLLNKNRIIHKDHQDKQKCCGIVPKMEYIRDRLCFMQKD